MENSLKIKFLTLIFAFFSVFFLDLSEIKSQTNSVYNNGELKLKLNEDGSHYIKRNFCQPNLAKIY